MFCSSWNLLVLSAKCLHTPLLDSIFDDRWIWQGKYHGGYLVRNTYHFCIIEIIDNKHFRVASEWYLISSKMKNPRWRLCHNCLPTSQCLRNWDFNCPSNCILCKDCLIFCWKYAANFEQEDYEINTIKVVHINSKMFVSH